MQGLLNAVASLGADHRLSSCGTQAWLLHIMWDLLRPGLKPVSLHWQVDSYPLCHQGSPDSPTFNSLQWLLWYICHHWATYQFSSVTQLCPTLWPHGPQHARPPCPSPTPGVYQNSCPWSWWCHPTISSSVIPFSSCPQSFPASGSFHQSALLIRWPKYWSFSFNISPSNEHSGLISFRIDWLDLLAVQGTLKSLIQYHSSKALILQHSAFFIVQLSHPYMTTRKTIGWLDEPLLAK